MRVIKNVNVVAVAIKNFVFRFSNGASLTVFDFQRPQLCLSAKFANEQPASNIS
jgi:hypothetical protein